MTCLQKKPCAAQCPTCKQIEAQKGKAAPTAKKAPAKARAKKAKVGETANRITANVVRAINMQSGCVAYRVNNVGVWDEKKQIHRGGNTEKGLPDVWACLRGEFVVFEVKAGKDKLSIHQLARKQEIERAKGVFVEVRSTDAFLSWFRDFLSSIVHV